MENIKRKYKVIKWIQSFADERWGGFGIVYQACSFTYDGEHLSEFYELDGKYYHKRIKNYIFLYFDFTIFSITNIVILKLFLKQIV